MKFLGSKVFKTAWDELNGLVVGEASSAVSGALMSGIPSIEEAMELEKRGKPLSAAAARLRRDLAFAKKVRYDLDVALTEDLLAVTFEHLSLYEASFTSAGQEAVDRVFESLKEWKASLVDYAKYAERLREDVKGKRTQLARMAKTRREVKDDILGVAVASDLAGLGFGMGGGTVAEAFVVSEVLILPQIQKLLTAIDGQAKKIEERVRKVKPLIDRSIEVYLTILKPCRGGNTDLCREPTRSTGSKGGKHIIINKNATVMVSTVESIPSLAIKNPKWEGEEEVGEGTHVDPDGTKTTEIIDPYGHVTTIVTDPDGSHVITFSNLPGGSGRPGSDHSHEELIETYKKGGGEVLVDESDEYGEDAGTNDEGEFPDDQSVNGVADSEDPGDDEYHDDGKGNDDDYDDGKGDDENKGDDEDEVE